jgi:hypothetical protein
VITFFVLKDRELIKKLAVRLAPNERRSNVVAMGARGWETLGGYLRGVALLGITEAIVIGSAVWLVGGNLAAAVVVVTLLGAFIPIVGAIVAGVVAVLVTLVTAGLTPALIVAAVALAVQQLDNELLAPWIYGKSLAAAPAGHPARHHRRHDPVRLRRSAARRALDRRHPQRDRRGPQPDDRAHRRTGRARVGRAGAARLTYDTRPDLFGHQPPRVIASP